LCVTLVIYQESLLMHGQQNAKSMYIFFRNDNFVVLITSHNYRNLIFYEAHQH